MGGTDTCTDTHAHIRTRSCGCAQYSHSPLKHTTTRATRSGLTHNIDSKHRDMVCAGNQSVSLSNQHLIKLMSVFGGQQRLGLQCRGLSAHLQHHPGGEWKFVWSRLSSAHYPLPSWWLTSSPESEAWDVTRKTETCLFTTLFYTTNHLQGRQRFKVTHPVKGM